MVSPSDVVEKSRRNLLIPVGLLVLITVVTIGTTIFVAAKKQDDPAIEQPKAADGPSEAVPEPSADEFMLDEEEEERKADAADTYIPACLDARMVRILVE